MIKVFLRGVLVGMLVGVLLLGATLAVADLYSGLHMRISYIEGYLTQLDKMLRGATVAPSGNGLRAQQGTP